MNKKVCVLSFKPLYNDPRINRQVEWLQNDYDVFTLGHSPTQIPGIRCVDCGLTKRALLHKLYRGSLLALNRFEHFYWTTPHILTSLDALRREKPDLIIANEIECLPLALKLKEEQNTKIIFDAHEFYPEYREAMFNSQKIIHKYYHFLCQKYISHADISISVSPGIIQRYKELFHVEMHLITNAPAEMHLEPSNVDGEKIKLIHHGLSMPDRYLELNIELMQYLEPRFKLYLMLMPNNIKYLKKLKKLAQNFGDRISFLEPVPMRSISQFINQFDLGLLILPPSHFSYTYSLPNKFFEYIQAKLATVISPFPEMEKIINTYNCGIVNDNFRLESLAEKLNKLSITQIENLKKQALLASKDLNSEKNGELFLKLIKKLIN